MKEKIKNVLWPKEFWDRWLDALDKRYPKEYYSEKSQERERQQACGSVGFVFLLYQVDRLWRWWDRKRKELK